MISTRDRNGHGGRGFDPGDFLFFANLHPLHVKLSSIYVVLKMEFNC